MLNDVIVYFDSNVSFLAILILSLIIIFAFNLTLQIFIFNDVNSKKHTIEIDIEEEDAENEEIEEIQSDDIDSIV